MADKTADKSDKKETFSKEDKENIARQPGPGMPATATEGAKAALAAESADSDAAAKADYEKLERAVKTHERVTGENLADALGRLKK